MATARRPRRKEHLPASDPAPAASPPGSAPAASSAPAPSRRPPPGGATIYSVAERAGVSIATVSRVLQGAGVVSKATTQKVLDAADELNYVPLGAARSLAVRQHEAHGLVLPELSGPYYSELLMGFESRAAELGHSVTLVLDDGKRDLARSVRQLAARVDAIAVHDTTAMPPDVARVLHGKKPVVIIAGEPQDGIDTVCAENAHSAEALTAHVLGHGRQGVLFVGDPDGASDVRARYDGFVAAHRAMGLEAAEPVRIAFREEAGAAFAEELITGRHDADALVCANDELALSVMKCLQDAGRDVPGDVAVVGWDDVMTARYVRPGLTTVRQPVHELGERAAERLHERLTGAPARSERQVLPTRLVLRESCGCDGAATTPSRPNSGNSRNTRNRPTTATPTSTATATTPTIPANAATEASSGAIRGNPQAWTRPTPTPVSETDTPRK